MNNFNGIKSKINLLRKDNNQNGNFGVKRPPQKIYFNINNKKRPKFEYNGNDTNSNSASQQRKNLPVYKARRRLLEEIEKYSSLIIIGETGSGKTTQIPQLINDLKLQGEKMIGITQPRRVAAITLAQRVAQEMETTIGNTVSYCVRFEDTTTSSTKIKYLTDGMLLREAMLDKNLVNYNVIILDEAHERTINTDVLFGIVWKAQAYRSLNGLPPLKIIIMSATMDVDHFSKYFNNAPIVYLQGRQYPVEVLHCGIVQDDYCFACLTTIFQLHKKAPPDDAFLVFLTGQDEIEAMCSSIRVIAKDPLCDGPPLKVYPLYAALNTSRQLEVFRLAPSGTRKIIISTNIAETSVTIPGIKYVIDSGKVKARSHNPSSGLDILLVENISQAQAWQRTGRAGRDSPGFCYRIYTKSEFAAMSKNSIPQIKRCSLFSVILQLLSIGINPLTFYFLDKPPKESIEEALILLEHLGAIDNLEDPQLTALGKKMARFPLDPRYSKIILCASDKGCLQEVISIVAMLSVDSVFASSPSKNAEAAAARKKFMSTSGDLASLLTIFRCYNNIKDKKQWCFENYLNLCNLQYVKTFRTQLLNLCISNDLKVNTCGQNLEKVRKVFLSGLFMNIAIIRKNNIYLTVESREKVAIHPSSAYFGTTPMAVIFTEIVQTSKVYMKNISPIDPDWIEEYAPSYAKLRPIQRFVELTK